VTPLVAVVASQHQQVALVLLRVNGSAPAYLGNTLRRHKLQVHNRLIGIAVDWRGAEDHR
jgi:hypothetical protein